MKIALYTYNTKPRGGVVHTLALAEALQRSGCSVTVYALGLNDSDQFYRPVKAGVRIVPFVSKPGESFDQRIERYIDSYANGLETEPLEQYDIHHVQDCISANSVVRMMEKGRIPFFIRTVHHLDDFITPALINCQRKSVIIPAALITVSQFWQKRLAADYERASTVIHNGVEDRFFNKQGEKDLLKAKHGWRGKTVFLTLGGIEPRKNTMGTLRAFARVKRMISNAVLVIAGGTTLFDYRYYLDDFRSELKVMDEDVRNSVRIVGSPDDETVQDYYQLADCYVQPSTKEGWGLAVMEAMAGGTPVVASDIDVFREFLVHGRNALLADPNDPEAIAAAMIRTVTETDLALGLLAGGKSTAKTYNWDAAANKHLILYRGMIESG